jgi:hypothetical protein
MLEPCGVTAAIRYNTTGLSGATEKHEMRPVDIQRPQFDNREIIQDARNLVGGEILLMSSVHL